MRRDLRTRSVERLRRLVEESERIVTLDDRGLIVNILSDVADLIELYDERSAKLRSLRRAFEAYGKSREELARLRGA